MVGIGLRPTKTKEKNIMEKQYENFYKVKNALKVLSRKMNKYENMKYVAGNENEELLIEKDQMLEAKNEFIIVADLLNEA